jgi:hypothetical protein
VTATAKLLDVLPLHLGVGPRERFVEERLGVSELAVGHEVHVVARGGVIDGDHVETPIEGIDGAWGWDTDYQDAFPNAAAHIVDLLEGRAENHSPGEEAFRSIEIIVGFYVSHYMSSQVTIPLDRPLLDVTITSW